jgi:NADPH:quinone reductase-like Zn-dependent oxidoreductase
MESIAVLQKGKGLVQGNITLPPLKEHQVYVRVEYAAFNPTDRMFDRQPLKSRNADLERPCS